MNLLKGLQDKQRLSSHEKELADYIVNHAEKVIHMSIRELCNETYSSTSTVIRLCKKLGLSGFKEFKIKLSRDLEIEYKEITQVDANVPFESKDAMIVISKKIAKLSKETIDSTQQLLNDQLLNQTTSMLMNANKIFAIGISHNFIQLNDFQLKMLKIGKYVHLINSQPEQVFLATNASPQDVAILVSYTGVTAEIENVAKILKRRKIPIIFITSNTNCYVARIANILIPLPNQENAKESISSFSSQTAIFYVLNVLYACLFKIDYEKSKSNRELGMRSYLHNDSSK